MNEKEALIEKVVRAVPYPAQITEWDISSEEGAIRFTWRRLRVRVTINLVVDEVKDCFLAGSDAAILLEALLKKEV